MFPSAANPLTAKTALSVLEREQIVKFIIMNARQRLDIQSEDLWRISRLNVETLCLARVTSDNSEISTRDGEDCAAILSIWVERVHLSWACYVRWGVERQGRHDCR